MLTGKKGLAEARSMEGVAPENKGGFVFIDE